MPFLAILMQFEAPLLQFKAPLMQFKATLMQWQANSSNFDAILFYFLAISSKLKAIFNLDFSEQIRCQSDHNRHSSGFIPQIQQKLSRFLLLPLPHGHSLHVHVRQGWKRAHSPQRSHQCHLYHLGKDKWAPGSLWWVLCQKRSHCSSRTFTPKAQWNVILRFGFVVKTSADNVILQIFDIFSHELSLFSTQLSFYALTKSIRLIKRLNSLVKMWKICKISLSAEVLFSCENIGRQRDLAIFWHFH